MAGERIDARRFAGISGEEARGTGKSGGTHVEDERGYIMVYEGSSGGAGRNPGVEPVEYLWRPRGSYFYLVREIALAESSRETRKIYPRYFALSPAYPDSFPPAPSLHPALFIQLIVLCRVFSHVPTCDFVSLSVSLLALSRREKRRRVFHREKVPFIFAPRIRRVFERRQRDMLMLVGAMKFWAVAESRISIKAIAVPFAISFVYRLTYI